LNDEAGRSVLNHQRQQTSALHPSSNVLRELIKPRTTRRNGESGLHKAPGLFEQSFALFVDHLKSFCA
jgi:hypothetical protein